MKRTARRRPAGYVRSVIATLLSVPAVCATLHAQAAIFDARRVGDHPTRVSYLRAIGELARVHGRASESVASLESALAMLDRIVPDGHPDRREILEEFAIQLETLGRNADADAARRRARSQR